MVLLSYAFTAWLTSLSISLNISRDICALLVVGRFKVGLKYRRIIISLTLQQMPRGCRINKAWSNVAVIIA